MNTSTLPEALRWKASFCPTVTLSSNLTSVSMKPRWVASTGIAFGYKWTAPVGPLCTSRDEANHGEKA